MDNEIIEAANTLLQIYYCNNNKCCMICNTTETPQWRKHKHLSVLCNRCAMRLKAKENRQKNL